MAIRTIYTSTTNVPVYASWKCKKCNKCNASDGVIVYQVQTSSSSFRSSKQIEASATARYYAEAGLQNTTLGIILEPRKNYQLMRLYMFLKKARCPSCHSKPLWARGIWLERHIVSFIPFLMVAGIAFLSFKPIPIAIFLILLGLVLYPVIQEKKTFKFLEKNPGYYPVVGTLNHELIEEAYSMGKTIPSPSQAREIVQKTISNLSEDREKTTVTSPNVTEKKVTPLLCAVSGYEDCPICHTRQRIGRKRCLGCNIRLDKTPVSPGPKEKSTNGVDEPAPKTEAASTKTDSTVSIPEAVPQGKTNPPAQSSAPNVRFCRKCGFELIGGSDFCSHCGAKIVVVAQSAGSENNEKKNPTIDGLSRNPIDKD